MTINKQSWHYRLWAESFKNERDIPATVSLCPYFWTVVQAIRSTVMTVVGAIFLAMIFVGMIGAVMSIAGLAIFQGIPAAVHVAQGQPQPESVTEGVGFSFLIIGLAITLIVVYVCYIHQLLVSTCSLGFGFAKAKLDGVCPTVSFKD